MIEQIEKTRQNVDDTLGILRANLELKHMFILWPFVHDSFQFGAMISITE